MTAEEYQKHRSALSKSLVEEPKNLSKEASITSNIVSAGGYDFWQSARDSEMILNLEKEELIKFYKTFCLPGMERVKISAHIVSKKSQDIEYSDDAINAMEALANSATIINDHASLIEFKSKLPLTAPPSPFKSISEYLI